MNPWHLSASDLLVWGVVLHLIADWPLQNDWMANNKMKRREIKTDVGHLKQDPKVRVYTISTHWWDRHPAAWVHAGIHGILLAFVFGWAAIPLAFVHLLIDTRVPVIWWSKLMKQTQPNNDIVELGPSIDPQYNSTAVLYDIGTEVRFWTDQVFHIACIAAAALIIG